VKRRLRFPNGIPRATIPEQLDAAENGQEFAGVLQGLFARLERMTAPTTLPSEIEGEEWEDEDDDE
jgi:hypothetical protein